MTEVEPARAELPAQGFRADLRRFVDSPRFQITIIILIVFNALILGLETYPDVTAVIGPALEMTNQVLVIIFAIEIALRIWAYGLAFFRNGWNIFDLIVVSAALIPPNTGAVLRLLRLLRVLRLLSTVRSMRMVMGALGAAVPGMISIGALLFMLIYVFAIVSVTILGSLSPTFFGDLWTSIASMFRVALGDGWEDIITPIALENPWVWAYFMVYGILSSVIILNLFVAVAVEGMDRMKALGLAEAQAEDQTLDERILGIDEQVLLELRALRGEVAELRERLGPDTERSEPI